MQHARLLQPPLSPRVCSNSCPLSQWSYITILCHSHLLWPSVFPSLRVCSNELALHIKWPKYWSFSISPSNEYSWFISFRTDWFTSLQSKGLSRVFSCTTVWKHKDRAYCRPSTFLSKVLHIQTQWSLVTIPFNKFYNYLHFTGGKTKFK